MAYPMTKKVTFNGIELSLPKYDADAITLFDYLENVVSHLEQELGDEDENFQLSINVDFSTSRPPKHKISANGSTKKKTKEKVARILEKTMDKENSGVAGSVKVNLLVEDRET
jgi:translation initiation factor 2 alpha subunit (eIF-2alpha)